MSLNGLDASAIHEAHQLALTEAGGWFLLKYVNRDTVEVLGRGTGGVNEAKLAVEQYEEKSPLYGLVQYRRKRVVLKYVPEGTSRLLQVRLTVQFQSILDAFPHDTIFTFTTPSELVDSALGLSTMLLPPVLSGALTPSSSSGRPHRLNEIREDGEETISASQVELITIPVAKPREITRPQSPVRDDMNGLPASAIKAKALLAKRKEEEATAAAEAAAAKARIEEEMTVTAFDDAPSIPDSKTDTTVHPLREDSRKTRVQHSPKPSSEKVPTTITFPTPPSTRYSLYRYREETAPPPLPTSLELPRTPERPPSRAHHTRHLSEHESDSISQWNKQVAAYAEMPLPSSKPKKKLAPRPHVDSNHRPKTPSSVVNLPHSVRASNRSNVNLTNRPESRQSSKSAPSRFVPATVVPPLPTTQLPAFFRSPGSRGAPSVVSSAFTESQPVPPEKLRLMRALQLRKRNVLLAQRAASVQSSRPQENYAEDFHARNMSEPLNQPPKVPSTPTMTNSHVARVSAEHRRDLSSTTASPTSITAASIDRSTIPSSVSGEVDKTSSKSFSVDTHSSSTPRANLPRGVSLKVRPDYKVNEDPDSEGEDPTKSSHTPDISPVEEAFMRLTGASTPPLPETIVEQPTPKADNVVGKNRQSESDDRNSGLRPSDTRNLSKSELSVSSKDRRRRDFGSMQTTNSAEISDAYSYDESFMEELRNATVQEAKPISVPKLSETPKMRKLSVDKLRGEMVRVPTSETIKTIKTFKSVSSEPEKQHTAAARSLSAALPHWPPTGADGNVTPLTNKPTIGSGISKRIKALEVLTHRESVQNPSPPSLREASGSRSTFTGLMSRASIRSPFQAPNASIDRSPPKKLPETRSMPPPVSATAPTPQPFVQRQGEATEIFVPQHKGETISVTARIIRNQARPPSSFPPHFNDSAVNLHRSPLIVEHERRDSDVSRASISRDMSNSSIEPIQTPKSDKRRFSFSSHKSGSTARQPQADGRASRMPIREKRHGKANSETSSVTEDKRPSRASRLMKRVSGIGGRFSQTSLSSKDNAPPETIMEYTESLIGRESISEASVLQMIDIGDVNVQFPETLLWKRRYIRIDDQGYLVFSPPSDNVHLRTTNRKFHLGDLKTPKIPDSEREEMAWSICIDLEDGRCIQCACESKQAQQQILKMLRDAHDAYNSLYS